MNLELRQLHVFLAAAKELHFSRAAQRLHVSQPALSQQIRVLERNLGATLFSRSSRMVELTPAGTALLEAAPRVLFEAERAQQRVREAANGTVGRLVIASVGTALASITPPVLRAMRLRFPELRLEISQMDTAAQLTALGDHRIDVGLVRGPVTGPLLTTERLVEEPLLVALPADHPLTELEYIPPKALTDEPFVLWPRALGIEFFDTIISYCRRNGFSPRIELEGNDIETQLGLVAAGLGVSLQPAYYTNLRRVGVEFRPLQGDTPKIELRIAWRTEDRSPAVAHFVSTARDVIAADE